MVCHPPMYSFCIYFSLSFTLSKFLLKFLCWWYRRPGTCSAFFHRILEVICNIATTLVRFHITFSLFGTNPFTQWFRSLVAAAGAASLVSTYRHRCNTHDHFLHHYFEDGNHYCLLALCFRWKLPHLGLFVWGYWLRSLLRNLQSPLMTGSCKEGLGVKKVRYWRLETAPRGYPGCGSCSYPVFLLLEVCTLGCPWTPHPNEG